MCIRDSLKDTQENYFWGADKGCAAIADINLGIVPQEIADKVYKTQEMIISGEIDVFSGELRDNQGLSLIHICTAGFAYIGGFCGDVEGAVICCIAEGIAGILIYTGVINASCVMESIYPSQTTKKALWGTTLASAAMNKMCIRDRY